MSYGTPEWQPWVLPEDEAMEHIKFAYVFAFRNSKPFNVLNIGSSATTLALMPSIPQMYTISRLAASHADGKPVDVL